MPIWKELKATRQSYLSVQFANLLLAELICVYIVRSFYPMPFLTCGRSDLRLSFREAPWMCTVRLVRYCSLWHAATGVGVLG